MAPDRSIAPFEHERRGRPSRRRVSGPTGSVSLPIGHINHIANDAALLFIYSFSLRFFLLGSSSPLLDTLRRKSAVCSDSIVGGIVFVVRPREQGTTPRSFVESVNKCASFVQFHYFFNRSDFVQLRYNLSIRLNENADLNLTFVESSLQKCFD